MRKQQQNLFQFGVEFTYWFKLILKVNTYLSVIGTYELSTLLYTLLSIFPSFLFIACGDDFWFRFNRPSQLIVVDLYFHNDVRRTVRQVEENNKEEAHHVEIKGKFVMIYNCIRITAKKTEEKTNEEGRHVDIERRIRNSLTLWKVRFGSQG